ncbi:hypothetical protein [Sphaerochaeta halotolerans]|jgi:hypothetical protein|uniref:hypothetical protein n=1 Tax=Sphaerochaeta halotolerans TaxID=2293840 RepID=UPI00136EBFFA|nr:hypothetical protein [Sphaerochaeta halotolerans]MXI85529.1 hypothetical protein [Sphaerochaeta halotolerans]
MLEYLNPEYLQGKHLDGRAAESALNLLDLVKRMQGCTIDSRYSPRGKSAYIQIGKPLHYSQASLSSIAGKRWTKPLCNGLG